MQRSVPTQPKTSNNVRDDDKISWRDVAFQVDSWSHRLLRIGLPDAFEDLQALASHLEGSIETVPLHLLDTKE